MSTFENTTGNIEASSAPGSEKIKTTNSENRELCEEFLRNFDENKNSEDEIMKSFKRNAVLGFDESALKSFSDFFRIGKKFFLFSFNYMMVFS